VIVLPGPVVLADPLPDGWRRCHALGCGAPAGHDGAHVPERVPPRAVCTCTGHGPDLACVEHGAAIRAWQKENGT